MRGSRRTALLNAAWLLPIVLAAPAPDDSKGSGPVPADATAALEEARRRMEPIDPPKIAGRLTDLARKADQARKDLEAAPKKGKPEESSKEEKKPAISKSLALQAAATAEEMRTTLGR